MKKRILAAISIAVISIVSSALIAYLKDPKNYEKVVKYTNSRTKQLKKAVKKAKKLFNKKVKEYKL